MSLNRGGYGCSIWPAYSHPEVVVREQWFRIACHATAGLISTDHIVFSRIIHVHPLVLHGLPTDLSFREQFDRDHLMKCDEVVVLILHCWRESIGVVAEIRFLGKLFKPVR